MRNRFQQRSHGRLHWRPVVWASGALSICLAFSGCVSKYQAEARAKEAFAAGVQQGMRLQQQTQQQTSTQSVRIVGDVKNPVLPWRAELTLAQAIVDAGYSGTSPPSDILIVRNGVATQVDVSKLLAGQDTPLQPGDVVQIK